MHPAALSESELLANCQIRQQRRSGPGGQHRNKVATAIFMVHQPTGLTVSASERRSTESNRKVAIRRMRLKLACHVRREVSAVAAPNTLWLQRIRGPRLSLNEQHSDYPILLAEALDRLAAVGWELGVAAEQLRCTPSRLLNLIARSPEAWQVTNAARRRQGLLEFRQPGSRS